MEVAKELNHAVENFVFKIVMDSPEEHRLTRRQGIIGSLREHWKELGYQNDDRLQKGNTG